MDSGRVGQLCAAANTGVNPANATPIAIIPVSSTRMSMGLVRLVAGLGDKDSVGTYETSSRTDNANV